MTWWINAIWAQPLLTDGVGDLAARIACHRLDAIKGQTPTCYLRALAEINTFGEVSPVNRGAAQRKHQSLPWPWPFGEAQKRERNEYLKSKGNA